MTNDYEDDTSDDGEWLTVKLSVMFIPVLLAIPAYILHMAG